LPEDMPLAKRSRETMMRINAMKELDDRVKSKDSSGRESENVNRLGTD